MTTPREKIENKAKPGVKITLDKERTLKLDLNAMVAFEEATGKSIMGGKFTGKDMTPRDLRAMLWACLLHEDEELTLKQVGSWITVGNLMEVTGKLNEAFDVAMPKSGGEAAAPLAKKSPPG